MVFTSHIFVFYFLPACLLIYYALPSRWRNVFITLASYVFYGWWKPWFVTLMLTSTVVDYVAARAMSVDGASKRRRKIALIASMCTNLGLLAVFKYAMLAQDSMNMLLDFVGAQTFETLQITLPIGISFYTFQTMSYTIDVYLGTASPVKRFTDFSCFVALFPQLIAGPIVRFNTIADQLHGRTHTLARFSSGTSLFILGFAKKILLANPMGTIADLAYGADGPGAAAAWFGATAYGFQIYFDFSGYSDMAIGLGRMLGFEFPKNFDSPYHSQSITEFWRRWHISLSSFLRDYLYIPLGGNRKTPRRTYINLALVMLLGGLWHGAAWQFVVWGGLHGTVLAAERAFGKRSFWYFLPAPLRICVTFALVMLIWVPFRAADMTSAVQFWGAMVGATTLAGAAPLLDGALFTPSNVIMMGICVLLSAFRTQSWDFAQKVTPARVLVLAALFAVSVSAMFAQAFNPFLYFQF